MPVTAFPFVGERPAHLKHCPPYMSESEFLLAKKILGAGVTGTYPQGNGLTLWAETFEGSIAQAMAKKGWVRILRRVNARIRVQLTDTIYGDVCTAMAR